MNSVSKDPLELYNYCPGELDGRSRGLHSNEQQQSVGPMRRFICKYRQVCSLHVPVGGLRVICERPIYRSIDAMGEFPSSKLPRNFPFHFKSF